jgi:hypothetical protein
MALLQLLFVLAAFVTVYSCLGCFYLSKRYDRMLETKFPDMIQSLSSRFWCQGWQCLFRSWDDQMPFTQIRRWRKAIKLGDDELTRVAKICSLLMYIFSAGMICLILLGAMLHSVL